MFSTSSKSRRRSGGATRCKCGRRNSAKGKDVFGFPGLFPSFSTLHLVSSSSLSSHTTARPASPKESTRSARPSHLCRRASCLLACLPWPPFINMRLRLPPTLLLALIWTQLVHSHVINVSVATPSKGPLRQQINGESQESASSSDRVGAHETTGRSTVVGNGLNLQGRKQGALKRMQMAQRVNNSERCTFR